MALLPSVFCLLSSGCWFYSFSGASIPEHLSTVAIPIVEDRSLGGTPGLDQELTDLLIERFARQTRLDLEPDEGAADAVLTAVIESYRNEPVAVTGNEVAALNRVTISVQVVYLDQVEDEEVLARSFSQFEQYPAAEIEREAETVGTILSQIADDIFTAATSDW
ncbi:MAG: LptE family protein [Bacteroidota bacterium]